jgi:ferredoxin
MGGEVVKLQISTACQGHGRCYTLAPQMLSSDDEGYVTISGGDPIDVPQELIELAREVAGTCPESAISLLD